MSGFANIFDLNPCEEVPSFFGSGPKKTVKKKEKTAVFVAGGVDFRGLTSPPSRQKTQTKKVVFLFILSLRRLL